MSQMTVHVRSAHEGTFSVGWSGQHSLVIDRGPGDRGQGMGFDGGQLMLLALGASYANEVFRIADERGVEILGVRVVVECDWKGTPARATGVRYSTRVEAEASEDEIMELIHEVDESAGVQQTLRAGVEVELCDAEAVAMQVEARSG